VLPASSVDEPTARLIRPARLCRRTAPGAGLPKSAATFGKIRRAGAQRSGSRGLAETGWRSRAAAGVRWGRPRDWPPCRDCGNPPGFLATRRSWLPAERSQRAGTLGSQPVHKASL